MLAVSLALAASLFWGSYDYVGGLRSRELSPVWMLTVTQGVAFAGSSAAVVIGGAGVPPLGEVGLALAIAAGYTVSLVAFFHAVTVARISIVAPISAGGATIPVLVGIAGGDGPGAAGLVGIVITLAGICVLCAATQGDSATDIAPRLGVALALVAALGSGLYFVGVDSATASVLWTVMIVSGVSFITLATVSALQPAHRPPGGWHLAALVPLGCLILAGNLAYAGATTRGQLAVVAVLASLYPAIPVVLARILLGERMRRAQQVGAAAALIGVGLMAL